MSLSAMLPALVAAWRRLRGRDAAGPLSAVERRDVVAGARALSAGLTRERELAGADYFADAQLLGAYLLLYWPVSYAQASAIFDELGGARGRVLDLGSGPAPMAIAALDAGADAALALDRNDQALATASLLGAGRALTTARWDDARALPSSSFDLVLAGHLMNELDGEAAQVALVESMLARLTPRGYVVLVEPALRDTSRALLAVRDRLVANGATVRAPCLYRGACPALARASDWCHAERPWQPPPELASLAAEARLHRDALKMSYLVLQANGRAWPALPDGRWWRIVSEPLPQKGQHRFYGCGPEGRFPLVLPEKHVRPGNRAFVELGRGDVVRIDRLSPRGDGLRLDAESVVTLEDVPAEGA